MKINRVIYRLWHNKSPHGKVGYIGKDKYWPTRSHLNRRKKEKGCKKLYRAFKKYSLKFWHADIIATHFRSDAALAKAEIFYIKKFGSKNKGYNCTDGGEGCSGRIVSEETKRKMSNAQKGEKGHNWGKPCPRAVRIKISKNNARHNLGLKFSKEVRKKLSVAHLGQKAWNKGKKASKKTRMRMAAAKRGKTGNQTNHFGRKHSLQAKRKMSRVHKKWWQRYKKSRLL